jgi:hypothetical protein
MLESEAHENTYPRFTRAAHAVMDEFSAFGCKGQVCLSSTGAFGASFCRPKAILRRSFSAPLIVKNNHSVRFGSGLESVVGSPDANPIRASIEVRPQA